LTEERDQVIDEASELSGSASQESRKIDSKGDLIDRIWLMCHIECGVRDSPSLGSTVVGLAMKLAFMNLDELKGQIKISSEF